MAELGVGWIAIRPDVSKITPEVRKALGASEREAGKSGDSMGKTMGGRLGGALKKSMVGTGVAAGGVLAASLTKGIGRLSAIEAAESKLSGLGNSAAEVLIASTISPPICEDIFLSSPSRYALGFISFMVWESCGRCANRA